MATDRTSSLLRALDRYVGIPLVATLGITRLVHRRSLPTPLRRVGLLKTAGIGDTILVSAIARDIAALRPDAECVLFTGAENAAAGRLLDGVTDVVELPLRRPWTAVRRIRRHALDLLIDCGPWPRVNAVLAALSRASFTVGFRTPGQARHFAYDAVVDHPQRDVHALDTYRALARAAGIAVGSAPALRPTTPLPASRRPTKPYVVCHMWPGGYRSELREWPWERWRELISSLGTMGYAAVLTGGPADVRRTAEFVAFCGATGAPVVDASGRYTLEELLDVLRHCRAVVSVNTGVMHAAAVLGVPTVALNGPTSKARWGPIGAQAVSVDSTFPGCGFLFLGWEYDGERTDCMRGIQVEDVLRALLPLIGDALDSALPRHVAAAWEHSKHSGAGTSTRP